MFWVFLLVVFVFLLSFASTFVVCPFLAKKMAKRKLVGVDMNKFSKPLVPEMGGISVFFGFAFGVLVPVFVFVLLGFFEFDLLSLFAAVLTVLIVGFIGVFDDLIGWKNGIRKWQHALFPLVAALPLMVIPKTIMTTTIGLPFGIEVQTGILYSLVLVPVAVTGASNAVNMLAGLNGLEAGLGSIVCFSLIVSVFLTGIEGIGKIEALVLLVALLGALLAFLKFNWFPAKIFGGDSLTLMIGAGIAASVVIGSMEKVGLMLFLLYFVELLFKAKHKMQSESFGIPQKDGTLKPDPRGGSITQFVIKQGKFKEPQVALIILGLQASLSIIVLCLYYLKIV